MFYCKKLLCKVEDLEHYLDILNAKTEKMTISHAKLKHKILA